MITAGSPSWWWPRLQLQQWMQSGAASPYRRTVALSTWWLPCVFVPLVASLTGRDAANLTLDFILSLDVPLALALATATALDARHVESHVSDDEWLWPRAFQPARMRWLSRLHWLRMARWPVGLVLATLLLQVRAATDTQAVAELLLMALLGFACGSCFAWVLHTPQRTINRKATRPRATRGFAALSWVALHESRDRFNLRRANVLAVPVLLAAPAGVLAGDVAKALALWLPLLFAVTACQEAVRCHQWLTTWLRTARTQWMLAWWVWRYVLLGLITLSALLWIGLR
jgi:hypothetical protein